MLTEESSGTTEMPSPTSRSRSRGQAVAGAAASTTRDCVTALAMTGSGLPSRRVRKRDDTMLVKRSMDRDTMGERLAG